jgi:hypothetical protein
MTADQRIEKIEEFVHLQRYLHGVSFRVIEDLEREDAFVIEIASCTQRQISTLNHRLRLNEMSHIRGKGLEIIPFEKPYKHKRLGKKSNH